MVVVLLAAAVADTTLAVDTEVVVAAEVETTETPAAKILGGKHIIIALRMFGPFFSS